MPSTRGRQVVVALTNKSGGAVAAGDVVVIDAANDESFTTTTTAGYTASSIGIAQETIASDASGRVLIRGYAALVNVSASATRGYYLFTHTVAKQATSSASLAGGGFGQVLKAGATPSALIWGKPEPSSSAGTFSDYSEDNSVIATTATAAAVTDLLSRTLTGLAAGTYPIWAVARTETAVSGVIRIVAGATPTVVSRVSTHTQAGNRAWFGRYVHSPTGDLTVKIQHVSEGASVTYGVSGDDRFGRKLLVIRAE